jgi:hypothetical protein
MEKLAEPGVLELIVDMLQERSNNEPPQSHHEIEMRLAVEHTRTLLLKAFRNGNLITRICSLLVITRDDELRSRLVSRSRRLMIGVCFAPSALVLLNYSEAGLREIAALIEAACDMDRPSSEKIYYFEWLSLNLQMHIAVDERIEREKSNTKVAQAPSLPKLLPTLYAGLPKLMYNVIALSEPRAAADGITFSAYEVPSAFTTLRVANLTLLYDIYVAAPPPVSVLDALTGRFWKILVELLFLYKYNNIFHGIFYKLFVLMFKLNNQATLKNIFTKTKLITRMIEHYRSTEPTGRSTVYVWFL